MDAVNWVHVNSGLGGLNEFIRYPTHKISAPLRVGFLDPTTPFFITLKLAVIVGLLLASPIIIYHIWSFLSPALLPSEKRAIVPSLYMGLVLFAIGVIMAYYRAGGSVSKYASDPVAGHRRRPPNAGQWDL